ncbi:unnamed protein product, partial [Closterium sp. Naga37s-1]
MAASREGSALPDPAAEAADSDSPRTAEGIGGSGAPPGIGAAVDARLLRSFDGLARDLDHAIRTAATLSQQHDAIATCLLIANALCDWPETEEPRPREAFGFRMLRSMPCAAESLQLRGKPWFRVDGGEVRDGAAVEEQERSRRGFHELLAIPPPRCCRLRRFTIPSPPAPCEARPRSPKQALPHVRSLPYPPHPPSLPPADTFFVMEHSSSSRRRAASTPWRGFCGPQGSSHVPATAAAPAALCPLLPAGLRAPFPTHLEVASSQIDRTAKRQRSQGGMLARQHSQEDVEQLHNLRARRFFLLLNQPLSQRPPPPQPLSRSLSHAHAQSPATPSMSPSGSQPLALTAAGSQQPMAVPPSGSQLRSPSFSSSPAAMAESAAPTHRFCQPLSLVLISSTPSHTPPPTSTPSAFPTLAPTAAGADIRARTAGGCEFLAALTSSIQRQWEAVRWLAQQRIEPAEVEAAGANPKADKLPAHLMARAVQIVQEEYARRPGHGGIGGHAWGDEPGPVERALAARTRASGASRAALPHILAGEAQRGGTWCLFTCGACSRAVLVHVRCLFSRHAGRAGTLALTLSTPVSSTSLPCNVSLLPGTDVLMTSANKFPNAASFLLPHLRTLLHRTPPLLQASGDAPVEILFLAVSNYACSRFVSQVQSLIAKRLNCS